MASPACRKPAVHAKSHTRMSRVWLAAAQSAAYFAAPNWIQAFWIWSIAWSRVTDLPM